MKVRYFTLVMTIMSVSFAYTAQRPSINVQLPETSTITTKDERSRAQRYRDERASLQQKRSELRAEKINTGNLANPSVRRRLDFNNIDETDFQ